MDLKTFAAKVKEMRAAQREYFKTKSAGLQNISNDWLKKSKALEKEVDTLVDQIIAGSHPQELF